MVLSRSTGTCFGAAYTEGLNSIDKPTCAVFLLGQDAYRNAKVLGKDMEGIQAILVHIPNVQAWVRHLCLDFDGIQGQKQRRALNQWGWQGVTFILLGGSEMKTACVIGRHSKRHGAMHWQSSCWRCLREQKMATIKGAVAAGVGRGFVLTI